MWKDDHEYVKLLRNFRMSVVICITRLAELLEQIKVDIMNRGLKKQLLEVSQIMSDLIKQFIMSLSKV
jgi:hypothetical protein